MPTREEETAVLGKLKRFALSMDGVLVMLGVGWILTTVIWGAFTDSHGAKEALGKAAVQGVVALVLVRFAFKKRAKGK